jgi:hypothetical protein
LRPTQVESRFPAKFSTQGFLTAKWPLLIFSLGARPFQPKG